MANGKLNHKKGFKARVCDLRHSALVKFFRVYNTDSNLITKF